MKKLWILTETGEGIGFGHVSRCSSIAEALLNSFEISMLVYQKGESAYDLNFNPAVEIVIQDWKKTPEQWISVDDVVLVDSYLADESTFNKINSITKKVIAIDDYYRMNYPVQMIINPNVSADNRLYEKVEAELVTGKDYVILRPDFRGISIQQPNIVVKDIVITVGGSDYRDLIPSIIENVCSAYPEILFHILTANENYKRELETSYPCDKLKFYGFLNAQEMTDIFLKSDIAISASGQTLGELVMTSTPFISFCIDVDQQPIRKFYLESNLVDEKIEWDDADFYEKLIRGIQNLLSFAKRQQFIDKSRKIIDGNGVERIADAIKNKFDGFQG